MCVAVYVVPSLSGQDFDGSFDAFSYALIMTDDPFFARQAQPFLRLYPEWPGTSLFIYAVLLHGFLLIPPLISLRSSLGSKGVSIILAAIAIPESAIFLGAISKEGLGIVAVVAALAGQTLLVRGQAVRGLAMSSYAVAIAELSRPFYGIPFGVALAISFLPALRSSTRLLMCFFALIAVIVGVWEILFGSFADEFTEKYQSAKQFLDWFEVEMGSDSPFKAAVRKFFSLAFVSDSPSPMVLLFVLLAAIGKTFVYLLAIPLIAPAEYSQMPAQAWALTWQVATSLSTITIVVGLFRLRSFTLNKENKCRLWFGIALLTIISISTAIFHVRYRAPAIVALLAAMWLVTNPHRRWFIWMSMLTFCATGIALVMTAGNAA
jgi:hypothetical protein